MLQTNTRFMTKLLEQLGGCATIKAEFLGASQDARYKGIRAVISLWQANLIVFFQQLRMYAHLLDFNKEH